MDYEKLLKRGRENLPEAALEKERFEIPKIKGHLQGNKTILTNFIQIAGVLRREPEHLLKFILKELATPGKIKKNNTVIIGAKINSSKINDKIRKYAVEFVLCNKCGKPDTKLVKQDSYLYLKCLACGDKESVKRKI